MNIIRSIINLFVDKPYESRAIKAILHFIRPVISRIFYLDLTLHTENFRNQLWLGKYVMWQPPMDLWLIQEAIADIRPSLIIEAGTNLGGAAIFYGDLFNLMNHDGHVVSIDIVDKKTDDVSHPKVTFLIGSSTAPEIIEQIDKMVTGTNGPIMVILDSDHRTAHVERELELYPKYVTEGSYLLVQDGLTDRLGKSGPLKAIKPFLARTSDFVLDREKTYRYIVTHHEMGWLKRITPRPPIKTITQQDDVTANGQLSKELVN